MQPRSVIGGGYIPHQPQIRTTIQPQNQVVALGRPQVQQQQLQTMNMMNDPEAMMMMQVMQSFGSMGLGGMFGSGPMMAGNPFEAFFNFSDLHQQLNQGGEEGTFVFQTQMTSIEIGPDGRPIIENYFQNNLGQQMNGNTISEKQQAYQNTAGVNRIAEERMLNNMGRKIVKQKRGNDIEETNHYFNIDQEQVREFDNNWEKVNRQNGFLSQHGRYLGYANSGPAMIQMGPTTQYQVPQNQPRRIEPAFIQPTGVQYSNVLPNQSSIRQGVPVASGINQIPSTSTIYGTNPQGTINSSRLAQNPFFNKQPPQSTVGSYVNPPTTTVYTQPTGPLQPPK